MSNGVSRSFVTRGETQPPTQPDPTRPRTTCGEATIHRHLSEARTLCGACRCPLGAECPVSNVTPASIGPRRMDGRPAYSIDGAR